jgi:hypothetical protein
MKAIEINGKIKTFRRLPKTWEDENGVHLNFDKIENPQDFGFFDVVMPTYDSVTHLHSEMFFDKKKKVFTYKVASRNLEGTYDVLDEDGNVVETKPNYDIEALKQDKIRQIKEQAKSLLSDTDWYVWRLTERGVEIPQEISAKRLEIIEKSELLETEVNALQTVEQVIRYAVAFYDISEI